MWSSMTTTPIKLDVVWDTIKNDLPPLTNHLKKALESEKE
jgi:uncharacterized protein with HEPN domain